MTDIKRRKFVTFMGASTVAIPVGALLTSLPSHADDSPMVDAESAAAKVYEYVEQTADEGKMCNNCALYQGEEGSDAGGCALFPGSKVAGPGWCKVWAAKPA